MEKVVFQAHPLRLRATKARRRAATARSRFRRSLMRSEDHYLHVVSIRRKQMIRYRLSDAVAELDPDAGLQISRSTWDAIDAITGMSEDPGGGLFVSLTNGDKERVTRSRRIAPETAIARRRRPA